jgi:PKD repeat protein
MKRKCFLVVLFLTLALFLSGCNGGVTTPPITTNQSPTASFTANPTSGVVPLNVSFNASNSSDSDGSITSYAWDFKDGETGNGEIISHTFSSTGSYSVKLTVIDNEGATDSVTKTITVTDPIVSNQSPTASFTANPTSGVAPLGVSFNASSSSDSDGSIISYAWDFKDGNTGNGQTINHTFSSTGSYSVKLTVTDDKGATDSVTKTITVTYYNAGADFDVCENILIAFYAALSNQNYTQALSYCKYGGATYDYVNNLWDLALEYPQFYRTFQIYSAYNFSYIGQSRINFYYDYSYTPHDIWGGVYDTEYEYGSLALFEKVNGVWKMP